MIKHRQLFYHDPENGIHGDCMRTAIACLLEVSPQDVPHFLHDGCDGATFMDRIDEYLADQGLVLVAVPFSGSVQEVMDAMACNNPNIRYLISGKSERGVNHVVIACNGGVVWDTHHSDAGLIGPCNDGFVWVEFLASRKAHK